MGKHLQGTRKKRIEAARWWAGERPAPAARLQPGGAVLAGLIADGAPEDVIEAVRARIKPEDPGDAFQVYAENWRRVLFFLQISTQWNVISGMEGAHRTGLNYAGVETQMPRDRRARRKLWADLLVMERAALRAFNDEPEPEDED